ncbi:MAG: peptide chain release factor N(5)-glutamine methyltransferase [Thermodesulfovibrionia bacterium]|nr:peptide chain release factor N(5)-glutamine methyltransferase [Thermodesulfovibrionia bacterium]
MRAVNKIKDITDLLSSRGLESAGKEAELILKHGLGIDTVKIYRDDPVLMDKEDDLISEIAERRSMREPLQYILGSEEFLGLKISVGEGVLIPRPETELLAEEAIKRLHTLQNKVDTKQLAILDLCTGSGCIALAVAKEFKDADVCGVDISDKAIAYAKNNSVMNGINNVIFIKGDLFEPIKEGRYFDLIISNPPYIKTSDIEGLQPEIREWEPLSALDGGEDGLDFYKKIIPAARVFLNDSGILIFELGDGCADEVVHIMKESGYINIETIKDYSGIERIVSAQWTR